MSSCVQAENLLTHEDEIKNRPARQWFQVRRPIDLLWSRQQEGEAMLVSPLCVARAGAEP